MANSVIGLPMSVEQVAVAIRQMRLTDRKRLKDFSIHETDSFDTTCS